MAKAVKVKRPPSRLCLTCKYEPDWGEAKGGEYPRRVGHCKNTEWRSLALPAVVQVYVSAILRYSDDSGIPCSCRAYERKDHD